MPEKLYEIFKNNTFFFVLSPKRHRQRDTLVFSNQFATKKNHEYVSEPLSNGDWTLLVKSSDASGNMNSSTLSFTVDVSTVIDPVDPADDTDDPVDEDKSSLSSSAMMQIGGLVAVLLILIAFIRVRKGESGDDEWT